MFGSTDNTMSNTPDSGNNTTVNPSNNQPPTGTCLSTTPISKKVIIGSITIVILVIIAIVLGVTLSSNNNNNQVDPPGFRAEGGVAINTTKSPSTTTSSNDNSPSSSPTSLRGLPTEIIPTSATVEVNDDETSNTSSSPVVSTATTPSLSSSTIIESSPSTPTSSTQSPTPCIDTPNYKDKYNSPCSDYELLTNELWCGAYGNDSVLNDGSDTPNVNCCVCKLALLKEEESEEGESVPWGEDEDNTYNSNNGDNSSPISASPCKLCPNGITKGEDYVPFEDDTQTCQELVDQTATLFNESDESCESSRYVEFLCCPDDAPQAGDSYWEDDNFSGSSGSSSTCTICPNGITKGDDYTPFIADGDATTTCKALVDEVNLFGTDFCDGTSIYEMLCCPSEDRKPCTLCPNGITAGDDYVPFEDDEDTATCKELVDVTAMVLSEGDESCEGSKIMQAYCCPGAEKNPCLICPNGLSVDKEDIILDGDSLTCKVSEICAYYDMYSFFLLYLINFIIPPPPFNHNFLRDLLICTWQLMPTLICAWKYWRRRQKLEMRITLAVLLPVVVGVQLTLIVQVQLQM